jgi:uncharacterized protein YfeS
MNNLIYIVYDRGFRLATFNFEEAINKAFIDSNLVVYDMKNERTLLDFYCTEDTLYELESELKDKNLIDFIPECKNIYEDLKSNYEEIWERRKRVNKKNQEDLEYEIYIKVKERLALD